MSWSDHKDDKSRFDGWREFLNEGERVPYKSINLDNPESFKQSYKDVIESRVLGLPKGSSYRKRISTTVEGLDNEYGDVSNEEGKEYTLSNLAMGLEQVNGEWKRRRDEWRLRRNLDDLEDLHALLHKELYPEDYKTYKAEYEDLGGAGYALKESQLQQIIREELDNVKEWIDDWDDLPDPAGVERYDPLKPAIDALAGDEEELPDPERRLARDIDRLGVPEEVFPPGFGELELDIRRAIMNSDEGSTFDEKTLEDFLKRARELIRDYPDREDMKRELIAMISSGFGSHWSNQI